MRNAAKTKVVHCVQTGVRGGAAERKEMPLVILSVSVAQTGIMNSPLSGCFIYLLGTLPGELSGRQRRRLDRGLMV